MRYRIERGVPADSSGLNSGAPGTHWEPVPTRQRRMLVLREMLRSPSGRTHLRAVASELAVMGESAGDCPDADLVDRLDRALGRGHGQLLQRRLEPRALSQGLIDAGASGQLGAPNVPMAQPAPLVDNEDWIEIEILDDRQVPVVGTTLHFSLPDGSTRTATTDSFGLARVIGLPPGNCEVTFLELDDRELEAG